jgi:hypothetical protein
MAWGDVLDDAPFDNLVSDLAIGPVGNGASRLAGSLTGHGGDRTDLLSRDSWPLARSGRIAEAVLEAQLGQGNRLEEPPAVPPEPDRLQTDLMRAGDVPVTATLGGIPENLGAQSDLLWGRVSSDQNLQGVAVFLGQFDQHGLGTTHDCLLGLASRAESGKPAQTILSGQLRQGALVQFQ